MTSVIWIKLCPWKSGGNLSSQSIKQRKNRNYILSVSKGIKKIYGIEITDAESIKKINEAMKKQYQPGIYTRVLHDIGNMEFVMVQCAMERWLPEGTLSGFFQRRQST